MREPDNIRKLEQLDVDYAGFIFYPQSPRFVVGDDEQVNAIRQLGRKKVGVFVNEGMAKVEETAEVYRLKAAQLHGSETPDFCGALREKGYLVVKAFQISSADDFRQTERYSRCADYFLFDTKCAGYGGSGRRFDWSLLREYTGLTPFLLSGGLTADCRQDIMQLRHSQFAGVDINSGFELSQGVKDIEKVGAFISSIRSTL